MPLEFQTHFLTCPRCRACSIGLPPEFEAVCPSYKSVGSFTYSGGGRQKLAMGLLTGRLDYCSAMVDAIFKCPVCGTCKEVCPAPGADPPKAIEQIREELVSRGIGPLPQHKLFARSIEENHNPYREDHEKRLLWIPGDVKYSKKSDVAYFVGCTSSYRQQHIAQATARVLQAAGVDFTLMHPNEWCCGSPLLRTGQVNLARKMMEHNIDALKEVKTVIFSCAGCFRAFHEDYPKYVGKPEFDMTHISQYLMEMINMGKLQLKVPVKMKVTYHDPCHLGRHCKIYEEPREILKAIPGIKIVEMPRNRNLSWCCGAGGGVKSGFNEFAVNTAALRMKEAQQTGAEAVVSACPFCLHNLSDASQLAENRMPVYDMIQLVARSSGI